MERHHQMRRPHPMGRDGGHMGHGGRGGGRDSFHGGHGGGGANFSSTACNICGHEGHKAADCPNGTTIWEGRYDFTDYEYFVKEELDTKSLAESAQAYSTAIAEGVDVVNATNRAIAIVNKAPSAEEAAAWVEAFDVQLQRPYFFNKVSLKSQWERPPEMPIMPPQMGMGGMPPNGMPRPPMGMMPPMHPGMPFPRP